MSKRRAKIRLEILLLIYYFTITINICKFLKNSLRKIFLNLKFLLYSFYFTISLINTWSIGHFGGSAILQKKKKLQMNP